MKEWSKVSPSQRARLIHKFADALEDRKEELAAIESTDNGKPLMFAMHDLKFSASIFRYYAGACERMEGISFSRDSGDFTNNFGYTRKEPVGVCGMITPWNFPMVMTAFKMAPFLASGCTGILKSPELAPLSSLKMAEIWSSITGTVPGVVNMLPGIGAEAGEALVDHPEVAMIAFTGSTAIGKRIMSRASGTVKRVSLELGGKSPLIVFPDADIGKAAFLSSLFGTLSAGQFCGCPSRIFVHEDCHD